MAMFTESISVILIFSSGCLQEKNLMFLVTSSPDGFEFEDNISRLCTIIPQDFDFANCKAGIPAMLCVTILSLLDTEGE